MGGLLEVPAATRCPRFSESTSRRAQAVQGLWYDVDTPGDLAEAGLIGVGRHTHGILLGYESAELRASAVRQ